MMCGVQGADEKYIQFWLGTSMKESSLQIETQKEQNS